MKTYAEQLAFLDKASARMARAQLQGAVQGETAIAKAQHERECLSSIYFVVDRARMLSEIAEELKKETVK